MVRWVCRVASWVVVLSAASVLVVGVLVPRLAGATPYTVLTGSMRPAMPPGTLVVVRPVDPEDIGVGTVVTYQLKSGDQSVVTHRVVTQGLDAQGAPIFRTQGDANDVPDELWVRPVQIRGEKWYSVPYLGYASNALTGDQRQVGVYSLAGLLLAYAASVYIKAIRRRLRRPDETIEEQEKVHV